MPRRPQTALQKVQEKSAYSKKAAEVLDFSYYDTNTLLSTTSEYRFFQTPLGQGGKNESDTNWQNAGQLPQGQAHEVHALKLFYGSQAIKNDDGLQALYTLMFNTHLTIKITGKDTMGTWLLAELFGMATCFVHVPTTAGDNVVMNTPRYTGIFPLNFPIEIGGTQSFEVLMRVEPGPNSLLDNDKIVVSINGKLIRLS